MLKKMDEKLLICACHSPEHQMIIDYDEEDNLAYVEIHLAPLPFFKRLKNGIKYIFGHRSIYGDFDEMILTNEYGAYLKDLGEKLIKNAPKIENAPV